MTEDVAFYVDVAREADGPLVEARGREQPGCIRRPGDRSAGHRHRLVADDARPGSRPCRHQRGWSSNCARGTCASSRSTTRRRSSTARSARFLHLPTWADRRRTFERVAASLRRQAVRMERLRVRSPRRCGVGRTTPGRTPASRSGTRSATTGWTSRSTTAPRARCGGRPRTGGSGSSTSPGSSSRRSTVVSTASLSTRTVAVRLRRSPSSVSGRPVRPSRRRRSVHGEALSARSTSSRCSPRCEARTA